MKKLGLILGSLVAVAAPVVAVVSCGKTSSGNTIASTTVGEYPTDKWDGANTKIENDANNKGYLMEMGNETGFKFVRKTNDKEIIKPTYTTLDDQFKNNIKEAVAENNTFISGLQEHFQLLTVVVIDAVNYYVKSTKNILIPHLPKVTNETDDAYKLRVQAVLGHLLNDQKLSYDTSIIPITIYDAPSADSVIISPITQSAGTLVTMSGMVYPTVEADQTLPKDVREKILKSLSKNTSLLEQMDHAETSYTLSYTNQLWASALSSATHISDVFVPERLTREHMMVSDYEINDGKTPFFSVPQAPQNKSRTLEELGNTLAQTKFLKANPETKLSFQEVSNAFTYTSNVDDNFDVNGKPSQAALDKIAASIVADKVVEEHANKGATTISFSVTSKQNIDKSVADLLSKLAHNDSSISKIIADDKYMADSFVADADDEHSTNFSSMEDRALFATLRTIAKYWWTNGKPGNPSAGITFADIAAMVTRAYGTVYGNDANVTANEDDFAMLQQFEWAAHSVFQHTTKRLISWGTGTDYLTSIALNENFIQENQIQNELNTSKITLATPAGVNYISYFYDLDSILNGN